MSGYYARNGIVYDGGDVNIALCLSPEDAQRIAAALNAAGVVEALEDCMGFMVWETKECNGKKCRDPECISCNGDEYAEGYVQRSKDAHAKARAALAAVKGVDRG